MRISRLVSAVAAVALAWLAVVQPGVAADTDFPAKPVKLVVPFAAYLKAEIAKFERIVREGHITVQ